MPSCPEGSLNPRTLKAPYDTTLAQMSYLVTQQLNQAGFTASITDIEAAMCDTLDTYSEWVAVRVAQGQAPAVAQTVALSLVTSGKATAINLPGAAPGGQQQPAAAPAASILSNPLVLIGGGLVAVLLLTPRHKGRR